MSPKDSETATQIPVYLIVTSVIVAAVVMIVAIVVVVIYCRRPRTVPSDTGNNEEDSSPKITRKPVPWDEDQCWNEYVFWDESNIEYYSSDENWANRISNIMCSSRKYSNIIWIPENIWIFE